MGSLARRVWAEWDSVLVIVKPDTVVRCHRAGFRRYWTWKSRRRRPGRRRVALAVRELIRDVSRANPLWGAPRVHGELTKLGITISQAAVSKYMTRPRKLPSQAWRSFLDNHVKDLVSVDFFTLPTATFRFMSPSVGHAVRRGVVHRHRPARTVLVETDIDATVRRDGRNKPCSSSPRRADRERSATPSARCRLRRSWRTPEEPDKASIASRRASY